MRKVKIFSLEEGHLACDYYFDLMMLNTEK